MANLKSKYYKLGKKAQSFWDSTTKVKILPNEVVEVSGEKTRSKKIAIAVANGHLMISDESEFKRFEAKGVVSDEDEEADVTNLDSPELMDFKLKKADEMKSYLIDTYEFTDDEVKEIKSMTKEKLVEKFIELEED